MDTQYVWLFIGILLIAGLLLYLFYQLIDLKLSKTSPHKWFERPLKETDKNQKRDEFYQKAYVFMLRIPFLRNLVILIRRRLETSTSMNEFTLRNMVMNIIFRVAIICLLIFTVFLLIKPSIVLFIWLIIGLVLISGILVDMFIYKVELRLLVQLKEYMEHIRFNYQQTKMIDESVYEAMQLSGTEMRIQAEKMHNMLTSTSMYKDLEEYENTAPNRFLKTIASLQVFVFDQGDVHTEKGSAFLRGLASLLQEINDEILYRSKLHYSLRSLGIVSVIPIFFVIPLQDWATEYFPSLNMFYNSWIGFVTQLLVYVSTLIAYMVVRKLKEISESKYQTKVDKVLWEDRLLKFKPFAWLIRTITPEPHQKRHYNLNLLIKEANEKIEVKHLYVRRILASLFLFTVMVLGAFYVHYEKKESILYDVLPNTMLSGNLTERELKEFEQLTANDRKILLELNDMKAASPVEDKQLRNLVITHFSYDPNSPAIEESIQRVSEKWDAFSNAYFKWWELLISVLLAFIGFWFPVIYLKFLRKIRLQEMENEVSQFYVLIGILREFDSMSVEMILMWMERFSVVFKDVLRTGILNYDSGPVESIQWMKSQATFIPFTQILTRLESAVTRVSIQEAFDDADIEREFYLLQRRDNNEKVIKERSSLGNMIGLFPAYFLVFCYLTIPFLWVSMVQMTDLIGGL